jgi:hypothetical protein
MEFDDESTHNMYSGIDWNSNTEVIEREGRDCTVLHEDFEKITRLAHIERFVNSAQKITSPAFTFSKRNGAISVCSRRLSAFFLVINAVLEDYSDRYVYSPRVRVFFDACKKLRIAPGKFAFGKEHKIDLQSGKCYATLFNELIEMIRYLCSRRCFRIALKRHERNVLRRKAKAIMWEREMFEWRSRHRFISLVLAYKAEHRSQITPEIIQRHRKYLLDDRRSVPLLAGIKGYVWKLEEGDKTGLHLHILISYMTKEGRDIEVGNQLGDYWVHVITDGMGSFRNSNIGLDTRGYIKNITLGDVNHNDTSEREGLRTLLNYLAKSEQYLKRKQSTRVRTFGMSQPPKKVKSGRPRQCSSGTVTPA